MRDVQSREQGGENVNTNQYCVACTDHCHLQQCIPASRETCRLCNSYGVPCPIKAEGVSGQTVYSSELENALNG